MIRCVLMVLILMLPSVCVAAEDGAKPKHTNALVKSRSPYLRQHAHNPVNWMPWSTAAFAQAAKEKKLIFLSIGYSTCHWCHVMEKECFEDEDVAALLNKDFVCIKVDREERPDIDNVYMGLAGTLGSGGGWPLTIVMTPQGKPFFAGTYIPKHTKYRIQGLMTLLPTLVRQIRFGSNLVDDKLKRVERRLEISRRVFDVPETEITEQVLNEAATGLLYAYDPVYGGYGRPPKFPRPHNMLYLLAHCRRTGNKEALKSVTHTLNAIRNGGIYDHLGGGIHRYAVDRFWSVPHFEKMLYDQAQYAMACTDCWALTREDRYREIADDVFTYVLRDLTAGDGGFFSAEDADSEGVEGKFYLWTVAELTEALSAKEWAAMKRVFDMQSDGNWIDRATEERQSTNVLRLTSDGAALVASSEEMREQMAAVRQKLFMVRSKRIRPGRDEKIMTDWNGLMIASLARAGRVFGNRKYIEAAARSFHFIDIRMRAEDNRLYHSWFKGEAGTTAFLDDHVFLAWGAVELYRATYEPRYLIAAKALLQTMNEHFWDRSGGGYDMTADHAEKLLLRPRTFSDMALPSGNAVALLVLTQVARLTGDHTLEEKAAKLETLTARRLFSRLTSATQLALAFEIRHTPAIEAVVAGEQGTKDTTALLRLLENEALTRNILVVFRDTSRDGPIVQAAPFVKAHRKVDGKAAAYICRGRTCSLPVTTPKELQALLDAAPALKKEKGERRKEKVVPEH